MVAFLETWRLGLNFNGLLGCLVEKSENSINLFQDNNLYAVVGAFLQQHICYEALVIFFVLLLYK
jgi:hypothetical protein